MGGFATISKRNHGRLGLKTPRLLRSLRCFLARPSLPPPLRGYDLPPSSPPSEGCQSEARVILFPLLGSLLRSHCFLPPRGIPLVGRRSVHFHILFGVQSFPRSGGPL